MGLFDFLFGNKKKERERQEQLRLQQEVDAKRRADEKRRQDEARAEKRVAYLAVFSTDWCGPSKRFLKEIKAAGINCFSVINAEENESLSEKYSIRSVPTILLLATDGVEIKRWEGYDDEDPGQSKFVNFIKSSFYEIRPFGESQMASELRKENQQQSQQQPKAEAPTKAKERRRLEEIGRMQSSNNSTKLPDGIIEDLRSSFYSFEDIKSRRMGPDFMLAPYDAGHYFEFPDADVLPIFANTDKINRFLPGLGFTDKEACKKRLMSFVIKTEKQLGITYVIRFKNMPVGMVFVNTPLYNKQTINLSIWTIDFYISEAMEHQGIMYNSILRVLNEMQTAMGAKRVYAMVDHDNTDCINLIGKGLFQQIDNTGFRSQNTEEVAPLVYMINLEMLRFEKR